MAAMVLLFHRMVQEPSVASSQNAVVEDLRPPPTVFCLMQHVTTNLKFWRGVRGWA